MKAYEDSLYEQWKENVEAILPSLLKRNLLIKPSDRAAMLVPPQEVEGAEHTEAEAGNFEILFKKLKFYLCNHLMEKFQKLTKKRINIGMLQTNKPRG